MDNREFVKKYQQQIVLTIGYLLVAGLAFQVGRITVVKYQTPEVKIEEVFAAPTMNDSQNQGLVQSAVVDNSASSNAGDCNGKIKGNIGSKEKIYHMPGGSFYNRTVAEQCFNTEAEAKAAGFRKSSR